jgi:hypothetical protein
MMLRCTVAISLQGFYIYRVLLYLLLQVPKDQQKERAKVPCKTIGHNYRNGVWTRQTLVTVSMHDVTIKVKRKAHCHDAGKCHQNEGSAFAKQEQL